MKRYIVVGIAIFLGLLGAVFAKVCAQYLIMPGLVAFALYWIVGKVFKSWPKPLVAGVAVQCSQVLLGVLGALYLGIVDSVLFSIGMYCVLATAVGLLWLFYRLDKWPVILLIIVQIIMCLQNGADLFNPSFSDSLQRNFLAQLILRIVAIVAMLVGCYELKFSLWKKEPV